MNVGVQIFFVLSGFIVALPFAKRTGTPSLSSYLLRRATRIEPPYLATLVLFFVAKVVTNRGSVAELLPHFASSATYTHNLLYGAPSEINFVAWSLEIEIQFYLLAPLLAKAYQIRSDGGRALLALTLAFAVGLLSRHLESSPRTELSLLGQFHYFLAGMIVADAASLLGDSSPARADFVGFLGWSVVIGHLLNAFPAPSELLASAIGCGLFGVLRGRFLRHLFSYQLVSVIGGMCYSIYLVHNYVIAGVGQLIGPHVHDLSFGTRFWVQLVVITPPVTLVSLAVFRWIEQPCMDPAWPSKLASRVRAWTR